MEIRQIDPDRYSTLNAGLGIPLQCIPQKHETRVPKAGLSSPALNPSPAPNDHHIAMTAGGVGQPFHAPTTTLASPRDVASNPPPAHLTLNHFVHALDVRVRNDAHVVLLMMTWAKCRVNACIERLWMERSAWTDPEKVRVNGRWLTRAQAEAWLREQEGRET